MSTQLGSVALVDGQQTYTVTFSPAFSSAPASFQPVLRMASTSAEIFAVAYANLSSTGCTLILNGIPSTDSVGSFIEWMAEGAISGGSVSVGTQQGTITVPQLVYRIGRRSRTGDFTKLDMSEQQDLLNACNEGLQKLYNYLPIYLKEMTQGFVLPAPLAITGVTVTQYSTTVADDTFTEAQIGATVTLDGDSQWNQVTDTNKILCPYMGATGTVAGTVYGDAWYTTTYPIDRIIGNPRFSNQGNYPINPIAGLQNPGAAPWIYQQSIGVPCSWWTQAMGNSQGKTPFMVLKFAPLPNQAYPVNVRIGFWPKRLELSDYQNASQLVIPSQFIEPALVPLCLDAFMVSPAWNREFGDEDRIWQRARDAENYLRGQVGTFGSPSNRIGTPLGF